MGTLCSTSVNLLSQSMEAVIRELSSQLTNLYFDVNIHQRTSMAYLSSNNDNIVTLIKYVACITAVSDIKNSSDP